MRRSWQTAAQIAVAGAFAFRLGFALPTQSGWTRAPARIRPADDLPTQDEGHKEEASTGACRRLSDYMKGGIAGLFGSPAPTASPHPSVHMARKPAPPSAPAPDTLADYVYTGMVTVNGEQFALIENAKTKEGVYVKAGDMLAGGRVGTVDRRGVVVSIAAVHRTLALNDKFSLVPMDHDAPSDTTPANATRTASEQTTAVELATYVQDVDAARAIFSTVVRAEGDSVPLGNALLQFSTVRSAIDAEVNPVFDVRD